MQQGVYSAVSVVRVVAEMERRRQVCVAGREAGQPCSKGPLTHWPLQQKAEQH